VTKEITIGRIVRYVPDDRIDGAPEWPAIITAVHGETQVDLQVFTRTAVLARQSVAYLASESATKGGAGRGDTWHWPAGVK